MDIRKDLLLVVAAKQGRLNLVSWESEGLDPSDMKSRSINNKVFSRPAFRTNGVMTPDDLAELANEYGYGQNLTSSEVIELMSNEIGGSSTYNAPAVDEIRARLGKQ